MKKFIFSIFALFALTANVAFAQKAEPKTIKLEQVKEAFTTTELTLKQGEYVFEIFNKNVDHAVGFVIAPKGKVDQPNHIKEAYLSKTIKKGETGSSQVVTLEKGEYVFFCPLNPTPQYVIKVE